MPNATRLTRDVAAKIRLVVAARSRQGWRWLKTPIAWADLRARPIQLLSTHAGVGIVLLLVLLLLLMLPWYAAQQRDEKGGVTYPHANLINPILGGLGALFLIYAAIRQARTASAQAEAARKQAQIAADRHTAQTNADLQRRVTETFSKAVEQLASDKMEVRVGGIYTLERLANETLADQAPVSRQQQVNQGTVEQRSGPADLYWTVMETLTAFVRERARWQGPAAVGMVDKSDYLWPSNTQHVETKSQPEPATDIAAVIAVVRRRPEAGCEGEEQRGWRFDLRGTDLRGADLYKAHLNCANLSEAHLRGAILCDTHLEGAILFRAHLEDADLRGVHLEDSILGAAHLERAKLYGAYLNRANLIMAYLEEANLREAHLEDTGAYQAHFEGANLCEAHLERADLSEAHLQYAVLIEAHLEGANLRAADLSGADGITQAQIDATFGDAETKLPEGLTRPTHWTEPKGDDAAPAA